MINMNETLEQETFEELNTYKTTYETVNSQNQLNNEILEENNLNTNNSELNQIKEENPVKINEENKQISEECTALVTLKENRLLTAQTMFKKSIKVSIKSFLISLSLSFLNLFI